jgi:IS605 OrfB family transposase
MKAISAQQEAAKVFLVREIWRKFPIQPNQHQRQKCVEDNKGKNKGDELKAVKRKALELFPPCAVELERDRLLDLLHTNPTKDNWLHRKFRNQYKRGHTFVRNQVVYQGSGYTCKRLSRRLVELQIQGLERGKRITLHVKSRHIIKGQIRVIRNAEGAFEVHYTRERELVLPDGKPELKLGIDKGYTEAFYTSNGTKIADGLGKLMSKKTERVARTNRNRYRLRAFAESLKPHDPQKAARILENNLGYKVKSRKLKREKATIQNFIRADLRRTITSPTQIICEDLTAPIKSKSDAKRINRKLNQWMKGELQASIEKIALETGSTVSVVNPAYTSQVCSQTGTLLGRRDGDTFTTFRGDVIQADLNAARNILKVQSDTEITRYMKSGEVLAVLLDRTVRYLASIGVSVSEALQRGWLQPSLRAQALNIECRFDLQG